MLRRAARLVALTLLGGACCSPEAPRFPLVFPQRLSEWPAYADLRSGRIAADALYFEPGYRLWSDGADKRRWVRLPPDSRIDTSDPDHWSLPVGTELWKEFSLGGVRLETRLVL